MTRRRRPPVLRVFPNLLLAPYALSVFLITLLPASQASRVTGLVDRLAYWINARVPHVEAYPLLEFLANVALFVPLGILLRWGWPRMPWWLITVFGLAMTLTIESVQTLLPSRIPAISDVVANTGGTALGALFVATLSVMFRRR
jgi:glycopeptide antibiotics resistance protein